MQKSLLSAEEIRQYCTKLFQFRCKTVRRYHSWKVGRGRQRILKKWNQQKKDNDNAVKKEINRKDSKEKYQKNNGEGATSADRQSQAGLQQGPCTMLKNAKVVSITRPASGPGQLIQCFYALKYGFLVVVVEYMVKVGHSNTKM